jgi:protein required for attachment to host cells
MNDTWILISNASRARLFSTPRKGKAWQMLQEFKHPESRLRGHEIMADRPGRTHQSAAKDTRAGMEPPTDPKEVEAEHFAQQLADLLEDGHGRHAYSHLVLVAPPQFLGLLRKAISDQVGKRVSASLDKDLTDVKDNDLPERVAEIL